MENTRIVEVSLLCYYLIPLQIPYNYLRMAEVDHHTWAPPLGAPAEPPKQEDKTAMAKKLGVETIDYSDFTKAAVPVDFDAGRCGRGFGQTVPEPTDRRITVLTGLNLTLACGQ